LTLIYLKAQDSNYECREKKVDHLKNYNRTFSGSVTVGILSKNTGSLDNRKMEHG